MASAEFHWPPFVGSIMLRHAGADAFSQLSSKTSQSPVMNAAMTSENDSFSAPDSFEYTSPQVCCVYAWVHSCASQSSLHS